MFTMFFPFRETTAESFRETKTVFSEIILACPSQINR